MYRRAVLVVLLLLSSSLRPILATTQPWIHVSPDAGVVQVLAAAPSRPSTIYAGLGVGGIFRSLDAGATWSFAGAGIDLHDTVRSLAVDAQRPDVVWAATYRSIYHSENGGLTWDRVRSDGAAALAQDPVSGVLYAGIQSGPMLRSRDEGTSWQTLDRSPQNAFYLAIDRFHPQTLYAGTLTGMFKSTNGGVKWFSINRGLPPYPVTSLVLVPRSSKTLYVAIASAIRGGTVFRSDDGGARWVPVDSSGTLYTAESLAVQPGRQETVWASSNGRPHRSLDRGRTWSLAEGGLRPGTVLTLLPGDSMVLAGTVSGVFRSGDQGASWSRSSRGMQAAPISGLAFAPLQPARLWAVVAGEVYRTATGGGHWTLLTSAPSPFFVSGPLVVDPDHPGIAYLGLLGGIARTDDFGGHWSGIGLSTCLQRPTIAVNPRDSSTIYFAGTDTHIGCPVNPEGACHSSDFRSDDAGQHWTCLREGLPAASSLIPDPFQPSYVYALVDKSLDGADIYVSADRGGSWSLLASSIGIFFLAPDPQQPGTLWGGGGRAGLLHSDDGGRTWAPWGTGIPQFTNLSTLAFDPVDPDILYVGTLQRGVFKSSDRGLTWSPLGTGLEGLNVRHLVIDLQDRGTVYAGTDEAGVLKLQQPGS